MNFGVFRSSLFWVVFVGLMALSFYLVLSACGAGIGWLSFCKAPGVNRAAFLQSERDRLNDLRNELLSRVNQAPICEIPVQEAAIPQEDSRLENCQVPPADEVLMLMDVSGSMAWDYEMDPALIARIIRLEQQIETAPIFQRIQLQAQLQRLYEQGDDPRKVNRIDVAKQALAPLVANLPDSARLRLLSFAECNRNFRDEGAYFKAEAGEYERALRGLRLRDSTALARAIDGLPSQTQAGREPDRPVNIVIVSDGADNCGGDPCAAAARLKRQLPYANVSVVSLASAASANACIAQQTDGRFLEADDVAGLMRAMRQTVGQATAEECEAITDAAAPNTKTETDRE